MIHKIGGSQSLIEMALMSDILSMDKNDVGYTFIADIEVKI